MYRPITLWKPASSLSSDDACTTILKYTLPPPYTPGRYESATTSNTAGKAFVPSLKTLCINVLLEYPEQVHSLGPTRVHYDLPKSTSDYDLIRSVIPAFSHSNPDISVLETVDPRLWAVIIQVLSSVPDALRVYTLPLSDIHLPLLQQIPQSLDFAIVTLLELQGCEHLNDQTIHHLGELHNLAVLDVGRTATTSWGIRALSKTLRVGTKFAECRGPWGLRILDLSDCKVDGQVAQHLSSFPLLSVVDLSGNPQCAIRCLEHVGFQPCNEAALFGPASLLQRSRALSSLSPHRRLFSHPEPFYLYVNRLQHRPPADIFTHGKCAKGLTVSNSLELASDLELARRAPVQRLPKILDPDPITSIQAVVDREANVETSNRATASFYKPLHPTVGMQEKASVAPYDRPTYASFGRLLRLYRPPAPWSSLARHTYSAAVVLPMKRPRTTDTGLHGDSARRSKQAQAAVQALQDMLNLRTDDMPIAAHGRNPHRTPIQFTENPFLRKPQSRSASMTGQISVAGSRSPLPNVNGEHSVHIKPIVSRSDLEGYESGKEAGATSTFVVPLPTTKPLIPISKLTVPPLPPSFKPPLGPHSAGEQRETDRRRSIADGGLQAELTLNKPISSNVVITTPIARPKATSKADAAQSTPKGRARKQSTAPDRGADASRKFLDGHEKTESNFDWAKWSGGNRK